MQPYLIVGKILKPHGVRGEVKVEPLTDDLRRFDKLEYIYIKNADKILPYKIGYVKYGHGVVYIKLEGINSMDDAKTLAGEYLWVDRKHAAPLPEGAYYVGDIIGCRVYTTDGRYLGWVKDIFSTGSNDVYTIFDGRREILIPAIKDVIKSVDIDAERIIIEPMEGLLD